MMTNCKYYCGAEVPKYHVLYTYKINILKLKTHIYTHKLKTCLLDVLINVSVNVTLHLGEDV